MKILVNSQKEAIDTARTLTQAANSIKTDVSLHNIEQTALIDTLCFLRDNVEVAESSKLNCSQVRHCS